MLHAKNCEAPKAQLNLTFVYQVKQNVTMRWNTGTVTLNRKPGISILNRKCVRILRSLAVVETTTDLSQQMNAINIVVCVSTCYEFISILHSLAVAETTSDLTQGMNALRIVVSVCTDNKLICILYSLPMAETTKSLV